LIVSKGDCIDGANTDAELLNWGTVANMDLNTAIFSFGINYKVQELLVNASVE
jgi:hypothetical protein